MIAATIALAGNPNVGKSTVFNALTGLHQHTGNWSGKTVGSAEGFFTEGGKRYRLIDLPGAYSLTADSAEEEVTRDDLCFEKPDAAVLVCDACCHALYGMIEQWLTGPDAPLLQARLRRLSRSFQGAIRLSLEYCASHPMSKEELK